MSTNAMPLSTGMAAKNCLKAAKPPADAPIATMGHLRLLAVALAEPAFGRLDFFACFFDEAVFGWDGRFDGFSRVPFFLVFLAISSPP